jgi:hypothetical protein
MSKEWFRRKYDHTAAQAAIIYLYVVGMAMGIAVYIYTSPIMDQLTVFHNNATQGASPLFPVSQNLQDSIFITQLAFRDWPLIYFILLTIAAYAAALKYRNTQV